MYMYIIINRKKKKLTKKKKEKRNETCLKKAFVLCNRSFFPRFAKNTNKHTQTYLENT